jgi:hypothetical protein
MQSKLAWACLNKSNQIMTEADIVSGPWGGPYAPAYLVFDSKLSGVLWINGDCQSKTDKRGAPLKQFKPGEFYKEGTRVVQVTISYDENAEVPTEEGEDELEEDELEKEKIS